MGYGHETSDVYTIRMKDLILMSGSPETFGTMVALLAPYVDMHDTTATLAQLGDMEVKQRKKSGQFRLLQGPKVP